MQPFFVVLSDDAQGFGRAVAERLQQDPAFGPVRLAQSAAEMERLLAESQEGPPHAVLLDLALPGLGGPSGAERLTSWWRHHARRRGASPDDRPGPERWIVVSPVGDDSVVSAAYGWGADYFVVRPFDVPTLVERLRQMLTGARPAGRRDRERKRRELESRVVRYMEDLGVPPHYKGRAYLKDAIVMVVENQELLHRVTKDLYPRIAAMHHTSAFKVERAIRHAIESTVARGNLALIESMFAHLMDENRTRPTNSSFIARMADQVRSDIARSA
ncbi:MAG: hypothetical protein IMX02_04825 [Limnochordaceae bacterium]|uniref:Sporulation initiation factor Spo0A C-terminal domain-containing protein n=1 Tax=Carboxydichorda subterranea TaxID=3109565 RepID=A0ABZ1BZS3_9FIRM|nr:sporulation initiation factor Spo0A C-terminal domain-containing protein [Limnochorda sp. L945t]MBE3598136.1 hypothetical protein [Limnochordaceae bacterium]WRP18340.1 sporulation initiation factor Spo0A C-terminal domain-containing protein [Limnochorda sp. L945t]